MPQPGDSERWKDRRVLSAALGISIACFPVACSVGGALLVQRVFAAPDTLAPFALWWLGILAFCTLVFFATERLARRMLPLAVLLKMGMAFPGRAPQRLAVARRAGSVRDLHRRVEEARTRGLADEPTVAAEKIVTLAATLSAHDRTTRGHAERVRALTDMIAEELHLPQVHRDRLRWSSLLHDIGKLAVHPDVLNKTGKLTDEEWEVIRRHPLEGARLTAPIAPWLGPWANTIVEHHERFDGGGYPFGVSGRHISLGGRIVAVADSYDVMTSARSYKKPIGPEKARQELTECAGTQFDPDVVRAFLAVSVWRLRLAAPFSWLASASSAKAVAVVARVSSVTGHSVAAGVAAGLGVIGLTAASPLTPAVPAAAPSAAGATPAQGQSTAPGSSGSTGSSGNTGSAGPSGTSADGGTGSAGGGTKATTTTTDTGKAGTKSSTTTTTTTVHNTTTTTTTGKGGGGGNTTTTLAPTTTTTTTPPPPAPPTGLTVTGQCQVLVIGPEFVLTWSASPSPSVTSYTVLRKSGSGPGGTFASIARVSSGTTSYADTSANGLGATYTYEIQANAPGGTATSASVSGETPTLCL